MTELISLQFLRLLFPAILMFVIWGAAFVFIIRVRTGSGWLKAMLTLAISVCAHLYMEAFMRLNGSGLELRVWLTELMKKMSPVQGFAGALMLLALFIWSAVDAARWNRNHITNVSVKKSIDALPAGILVYTEAGLTIAVNPAMERIAESAFGMFRINGADIIKKLKELKDNVIRTDDGHFYTYRKNEMIIDGVKCYELICDDVSEEYNTKLALEKENERLRAMNRKQQELNRTIDSMVIEDEILQAKVMVHDRLGQALLATRYYLEGEDKPSGKATELLDMWKEEIGFFEEVPEHNGNNEFAVLKSAADDVGIKLLCDGEEIVKDPFADDISAEVKHVFITAIHECMTNTLRHAGGDELYISFGSGEKKTLKIRNNGTVQAEEIHEKGGLKNLRDMTENCGGSMYIHTENGFELIIEI